RCLDTKLKRVLVVDEHRHELLWALGPRRPALDVLGAGAASTRSKRGDDGGHGQDPARGSPRLHRVSTAPSALAPRAPFCRAKARIRIVQPSGTRTQVQWNARPRAPGSAASRRRKLVETSESM